MGLIDLLGENWEATKKIAKARISNFFKGNTPKYLGVGALVASQLLNPTAIYAEDNENDYLYSKEYRKLEEKYLSIVLSNSQSSPSERKEVIEEAKDFILQEDKENLDILEKDLLIDMLARTIRSRPEEQEIVNFTIDTLEEIGSTKKIHPLNLINTAEEINHTLTYYMDPAIGLPKKQETYSKLEKTFMNLLPNMTKFICDMDNWKEKQVPLMEYSVRNPDAINLIEIMLKHSKIYRYEYNKNDVNEDNLQILEKTMEDASFYIKKGLSSWENCPIAKRCDLLNIFVYNVDAPGADKFLIEFSPYIPQLIVKDSSIEERDYLFETLIENLKDEHHNYKGPLEVLQRIASQDYSIWEKGTKMTYGSDATKSLCDMLFN
jgi:hypothetical protein